LHLRTRVDGSVGWITVSSTEIHVNGMLIRRPIVGLALVCSSSIKLIDTKLYKSCCCAKECSNSKEVSTFGHRNLL